ncbi:MAG: sporulation protein [Lachnospiraceae bacterium]|nr:sporulation protein [Lachnospiraceae bacterium]
MADNKFESTVETLFKGMDGFLTTKTVVGDAIKLEDGTIILPLVDVSFGVGAGAWQKKVDSCSSGGGMGGKITPNAVLVIKDGVSRLINVKNQDTVTKLIDLVPDIVDRIKNKTKYDEIKKDVENKYQDGQEDGNQE